MVMAASRSPYISSRVHDVRAWLSRGDIVVAPRVPATAGGVRAKRRDVIDGAGPVHPVAHLVGRHDRRRAEAVEVVMHDDRTEVMLGFAREDGVADPRDTFAALGD